MNDTVKRIRQATDREKIFARDIADKKTVNQNKPPRFCGWDLVNQTDKRHMCVMLIHRRNSVITNSKEWLELAAYLAS